MFTKLYDAARMTLCGFGLIFRRPKDRWIPRYDGNGEVYLWLRERE